MNRTLIVTDQRAAGPADKDCAQEARDREAADRARGVRDRADGTPDPADGRRNPAGGRGDPADGRRVWAAEGGCAIRTAGPGDADAIRDFFHGLSLRTRYLRFFGGVSPSSSLLRALSGGTGRSDILLVTDSCGAVIGHGMAVDAAQDGQLTADIGLVVADSWQGRGLGSALLSRLAGRAADRGVATLAMEVLPDNARMLRIIQRRWPGASRQRTPDSIVIRAALAQTMDGGLPGQLSRFSGAAFPVPGPVQAGPVQGGRHAPARSAA
jgi:GNAT superfamily N-acetyltransferase